MYKTIKYLILLLEKSKILHKDYLENGKKFYLTKEIRIINQNIYDLINQKDLIFSVELKRPISNLKEHLIDWISLWESERVKNQPGDMDVFVFHGYKQYPKYLDKILKDFVIEKNSL